MEELFEMHKKILEEMHDLYVRKNQDYGNSVHDTYLKFGPNAYLVRMYDKLNRIHHLTSSGCGSAYVTDERIQDTLLDLANYAILMSMELRRDQGTMCTSEVKYRG